jgi:phosphoglycolate phosphatase
MPRGVVFDLDGTLVDSLRDIAVAMDRALEDLGLPRRTLAEYERFIGDGARMLVRRAIGEAPYEDEALERFRARYSEHLVVHTRAYPGVEPLLAELARREVPTAVLSNKPHAWTEEIVRTIFPAHPFARVLGHRSDAPHKPDPASALEIARALELPCERIFFVGDTAVDIDTARRAGMIAVAVLWGMRTREELAGAAHCITEPSELLALLND